MNADGKVSGFVIDFYGFGMWTGFIDDSEYGTYEEFLHSWGVIPQGIDAQGQNVGSVGLGPNEAYPGSPEGSDFEYLWLTDGEFVHLSPCDPDAPPPPLPAGWMGGTDVYSFKIRNDGVLVGQCVDWQYDCANDVFIVFGVYGLIGTPVK